MFKVTDINFMVFPAKTLSSLCLYPVLHCTSPGLGHPSPALLPFLNYCHGLKKKDPKDTVSSYSALLWQELNKYLLSE